MKNWLDSNEYALVTPAIEPGDIVTMLEISTGAFKLIRDNKTYKLQLRHNEHELSALRIHQELLKRGWDLPKIAEVKVIEGKTYTLVDWWPGVSGLERREALGPLTEEYYYKLGEFAGKLNNEKIDGQFVSVLNYWPRNTLINDKGDVTYIDLNKLYLTDFPEAFTVKTIVAETPSVSRKQATAFICGYRKHRPYSIRDILDYYATKMFRRYQDIYIKGKLAYPGIRPVKLRLDMMKLPERLDGKWVLDLGYANGSFSLECARRGAKRVIAYDNYYRNIGPAHHRISDWGKLLGVYHGFTEDNLLYKHTDIDTEWFITKHIPDSLRYIPHKKYDIIIAFAIADHIKDKALREKFFKMLSDSTDCLYYESRMGGRQVLETERLKRLTTFDNIEYLGNASCNERKFRYALFKCTRSKKD